MATRVKASDLGKIKDPKSEGFKITPQSDEKWKDEIRGYYQNSADQNVKSSNDQYDSAISQSFRSALARGMGRSSYALATGAGLANKKAEAANQIRTNAEHEANMAIINQQNVKDQMAFQQQQAAQQQQNWQASFDAQQAQQQWQNQFQENQQAWQNEYQQDLFKYQYLLPRQDAMAATSATAQTTPVSSYNPNPNPKPNPQKDDQKEPYFLDTLMNFFGL